jgi:general secretion pathway protein J
MSPRARRLAGRIAGSRIAGSRGFTLLEVMVSVGIISLLGVLIYGAFMGMNRSKTNMDYVADRYQQGRQSIDRMSRELSAAFISAHRPISQVQTIRETAFIGKDSSDSDRLDFTAFANQRLAANKHTSDQAEVGFFLANDPDTGNTDLVRRLSRSIDDDPTRGGVVQVMAEDVQVFDVKYLDPVTNDWVDDWDSTQPSGQLGRLPGQVWILLVLGNGRGKPITFQTKVVIPIQLPLDFATK